MEQPVAQAKNHYQDALIQILVKQRDEALNQAAHNGAESAHYQALLQEAYQRLQQLETQLAQKTDTVAPATPVGSAS